MFTHKIIISPLRNIIYERKMKKEKCLVVLKGFYKRQNFLSKNVQLLVS